MAFVPLSALGGRNSIANMYRQVSGGQYTPTQQDIAQWGANPDPQYLQQIAPAIQQWWNQNKDQNPTGAQPGGDVYGPSAPYGGGGAPGPPADPNAIADVQQMAAGFHGGPGDQIANMYRQVSGGAYTPTQQDIGQWGAHPDAQYLNQIAPAIQQWWNQNQAQHPTGAQPGGDVYGPSAPYYGRAGGFMPLSRFAGGMGGWGGLAGWMAPGGGYQQAYQQGKIPGSPGYQAAVQQNPGIDPQTGQPWQATDQGGWGNWGQRR